MHSNNGERPLTTFLVLGYNQERFIREAVEGAFAQTYSPMEIILSDDCSTDRTFEIMCDMADSYRGRHWVKLNRTPCNKGIAANINSAMALAVGELVVFAAGDDRSLSHRAETLTLEWVRSGKPSGIGSGMKNMDEQGNPLGPSEWGAGLSVILEKTPREQMLRHFAPERKFALPGCSAAWSMETWNTFGDLMETVVLEDDALSFRSLLHRGLRFIEEPLVLYRRHTQNLWSTITPKTTTTPAYYKSSEEKTARRAALIWKMYLNALADLKFAVSKNLIDSSAVPAIEADIKKEMSRLENQAKWWDLPFFRRLGAIADSPHRRFPLNVMSLLPLDRHSALRCALSRIKRKWSRA